MKKIIQLDRHVADLIAAGEVVERPASAAKELLENSIDAGAQNVTVEIKAGGMTYIRVTDDGSGMSPQDAETSFLRHATSKLRDERGLEAISTLGFRGEALAAISAVSRMELITREQDSAEGCRILAEGGTILSAAPFGCPSGTTMIVRDLFFNTPARLKFVKTDRAEGSAVSGVVLRTALSHPEVSIKYIKDGKTEYHTPGDGLVQSCVYSLFGREFAKGLLAANASDDAITVTGFVSSPAHSKGNRGNQYFFVNGRFVKSKSLQAALEQAYKNTLFTGRFPSCVLYITISPASVDVNVHPTKTEVKFSNERAVFDGVYYGTLGALEKERAGVEASVTPKQEMPTVLRDTTLQYNTTPSVSSKSTGSGAGYGYPRGNADSFYKTVDADLYLKNYATGTKGATSYKKSTGDFGTLPKSAQDRPQIELPAYNVGGIPSSLGNTARPQAHKAEPAPIGQSEIIEVQDPEIENMPPENPFRIIGEALNTYIVVEKGESLWLVDKHAAHERIHFNRLKDQFKETMVQPLLLPVVCHFSPEDTQLILDSSEILEKLGFMAESFGQSNIAIRQIPSHIDQSEVESVINEICGILKDGGEPGSEAIIEEILHTVACKAAIKAGRISPVGEFDQLVARVLSGEIRYCPHGRPVAIELTKSALDKNFKRT